MLAINKFIVAILKNRAEYLHFHIVLWLTACIRLGATRPAVARFTCFSEGSKPISEPTPCLDFERFIDLQSSERGYGISGKWQPTCGSVERRQRAIREGQRCTTRKYTCQTRSLLHYKGTVGYERVAGKLTALQTPRP